MIRTRSNSKDLNGSGSPTFHHKHVVSDTNKPASQRHACNGSCTILARATVSVASSVSVLCSRGCTHIQFPHSERECMAKAHLQAHLGHCCMYSIVSVYQSCSINSICLRSDNAYCYFALLLSVVTKSFHQKKSLFIVGSLYKL
jgi:hypothetical protein